MRISGTKTIAPSNAPVSRRVGSGGFALAEGEGTRAAASAPPLRMIGGIDVLVALQGMEDATERRRRGVKKGKVALDLLDELKVGLLGGDPDPSRLLLRLKASVSDLRESSGEAGLDGILAEIELRVAVEIAKLTQR